VEDEMPSWLKENLLLGLKTSPLTQPRPWVLLVVPYALIALSLGWYSGLFRPVLLDVKHFFYLPLTLFAFPAFLEEVFFRGILIPRNVREKGPYSATLYCLFSSVSFVLWHPLNAITINPTAQHFFLNPFFLLIVFFLGLACSLSYVYTKSLWAPVAIHWVTIVVWVLFLGGRNLLLNQ
jgi:uncharacterized protein